MCHSVPEGPAAQMDVSVVSFHSRAIAGDLAQWDLTPYDPQPVIGSTPRAATDLQGYLVCVSRKKSHIVVSGWPFGRDALSASSNSGKGPRYQRDAN